VSAVVVWVLVLVVLERVVVFLLLVIVVRQNTFYFSMYCLTHSTTLRCPALYMIASMVSVGVGLTGGKIVSSSASMVLLAMPVSSSILREVDIAVFKERWHPCSLGGRKLGGFPFIHQAITRIQPKFFVQIFIGSIYT